MDKNLNDVSVPIKIELKSLRKEKFRYTFRLHVNGKYAGTQSSYADSIKKLKEKVINAIDFRKIG